jgi:enoyl-CoA hydratase/carnithine racemase
MSNEGQVTTERRGQVLLIGLDRAAKRNAVDFSLFSALGQAYGQLERDDDLHCGVLFAHGDHFCAGIDLLQFAPAIAQGGITLPEGALDPTGLYGPRLSKPVVSAIHGVCIGIGLELLLATDICVADTTARFTQIEVKRGLYPAGGATIRFPRQTGWGNAMRYLLTGDEFSAEEALRIGLAQEVTAPGEHIARAAQLAETIAAQAPLGVRATLASARQVITAGEETAIEQLQPEFVRLLQSADAQEGVQAFLERRPPHYQGR